MIGQNMFLVPEEIQGVQSFKAIPLTKDCPYLEMYYDPAGGALVILSTEQRERLQTVTKMTPLGEIDRQKGSGKPLYRQIQIHLPQDMMVYDKDASRELVKMFCVNADTFDTESIFQTKSRVEIATEEAEKAAKAEG
jgi:hypothetical protein